MDSKSTSPVEIINSVSVISIARQTYDNVVISIFPQNEEEISQLVMGTHWLVFYFSVLGKKNKHSSQDTSTVNKTCGAPTCNKTGEISTPFPGLLKILETKLCGRELVSARRFLLSSSLRNQASFKHVKAAEKKPRIQARQSDFLLAIVKFRSFWLRSFKKRQFASQCSFLVPCGLRCSRKNAHS